jgi:hypothetical protein
MSGSEVNKAYLRAAGFTEEEIATELEEHGDNNPFSEAARMAPPAT